MPRVYSIRCLLLHNHRLVLAVRHQDEPQLLVRLSVSGAVDDGERFPLQLHDFALFEVAQIRVAESFGLF